MNYHTTALGYVSPSLLSDQELMYQPEATNSYWLAMHPDGIILNDVELFVDRCFKSSDLAFTASKAFRPQQRYRPCSNIVLRGLDALRTGEDRLLFNPSNCFSAKVELCISLCKKLGLSDAGYPQHYECMPDGSSAAEAYNRLVDEIRTAGNTRDFKIKLYREADRLKRNRIRLKDYVAALFAVRSRLTLIRVDLKYRKDVKASISFEQARRDFDRFLDNMRHKPKLFRDLEGYIWRMECGKEGGYHFHVILFFNNDHFQNDSHHGELIKQYWDADITAGRGNCFNCNRAEYKRKFEQIDHLAIGRVEASDFAKRTRIDKMLEYLCKSEQQIRVKPTKRARTMGHRQLPPQRPVKLGRPRASGTAQYSLPAALM